MSKKGGKSTPKQLDKSENRVTPTNEFIPGIPDTEWDFLNEIEQRDSFLGDLVDEIVSSSLDGVTEKWVNSYAAVEAVDKVCTILQNTIDVYFLSYDKGNDKFDLDWAEDNPPKPSIIDSWANGKVPVVQTPADRPESRMTASTSSTMITIDASTQRPSSQKSSNESIKEKYFLGPSAGPQLTNKLDELAMQSSPLSPSKEKTKLKPFKRYTGRLKSAKLKNLTTPLAKSEEQLLKSQLKDHLLEKTGSSLLRGVPKNFSSSLKTMQKSNSLVEYDEQGNVRNVVTIPPGELPKLHRTKPDFKVEDDETMTTSTQSSRKRDQTRPKKIVQPTNQNIPINKRLSGRIIDNIDLQSGVTLQTGDIVRTGPKQSMKGSRIVDLAPIRLVQPQKISASDIVK